MSTIKDVLARNIEENIAPVIYFHQLDPEIALQEVREYVFTTRPHTSVTQVGGIHEQMVTLLSNISIAIDKGHQLPASWISGYFGSGKSSFAKLLGLALDGMVLPNGQNMDQALLERDDTSHAERLRTAMAQLQARVKSQAVIFDIGTHAKNNESIPHTVYREILKKLKYSEHDGVAQYEIALEDEGRYAEFLKNFEELNPGRTWAEQRDGGLAVQKFRAVYRKLFPDHDELLEVANFDLHSLTVNRMVANLIKVLERRAPGQTIFIVVDEVSQYISKDHNKMLDLQSFVSDIGGKVKAGRSPLWLLVTGQEKLEEEAKDSVLFKLQDRFPKELRVHLDRANVREVVGRRLLKKKPDSALHHFVTDEHLNALKLYGYEGPAVTRDELIANYPLLPGHIPLFMEITQSIRNNSMRTQSDAGGVRSVLNNIWDLFNREPVALKNRPLGALMTLDMLYDVIGSSVDSDVQLTMAKIFDQHAADSWESRTVKAIALLELGGEQRPVGAELLSKLLYPALGSGPVHEKVEAALATLKAQNWIQLHEKTGWSVQNNAAQDWNRQKNDISVPSSEIDDTLKAEQVKLVSLVAAPEFLETKFPIACWWGSDVKLPGGTGATQVGVCFHWATSVAKRNNTDEWLNRSREDNKRFHWVSGETTGLESLVRDLLRSQKMAARIQAQPNLQPVQTRLLFQEKAEGERLLSEVGKELRKVWLKGTVYFSGTSTEPSRQGASFEGALKAEVEAKLAQLFHKFPQGRLKISDSDFKHLLKSDVGGLSKVFFDGAEGLGIAVNDGGHIHFKATGAVPMEVLQLIEEKTYRTGDQLIDHFASAPYGYSRLVIKSAVVGLLREEKVRLCDSMKAVVSSVLDPGATNLLEQDKEFNKADVEFRQSDGLTARDRTNIRQFFAKVLRLDDIDASSDTLANLVFSHFSPLHTQLSDLQKKLGSLWLELPKELDEFRHLLTECTTDRNVERALLRVKANLAGLEGGFVRLRSLQESLTPSAQDELRKLKLVLENQGRQLVELGEDSAVKGAIGDLEGQWRQPEPWKGYADVKPSASAIENHYLEVRRRLHDELQRSLEMAQDQLKLRPDFSNLDQDQQYAVLQVVRQAYQAIDPAAVHPSLLLISQGPSRVLESCAKAQALVDKFVNEKLPPGGRTMKTVKVGLKNTIVTSEAELDLVLARLRERSMVELNAGLQVRFEE